MSPSFVPTVKRGGNWRRPDGFFEVVVVVVGLGGEGRVFIVWFRPIWGGGFFVIAIAICYCLRPRRNASLGKLLAVAPLGGVDALHNYQIVFLNLPQLTHPRSQVQGHCRGLLLEPRVDRSVRMHYLHHSFHKVVVGLCYVIMNIGLN